MTRLTRKVSQARTRSQLIEAAGKVFADRGLERATMFLSLVSLIEPLHPATGKPASLILVAE